MRNVETPFQSTIVATMVVARSVRAAQIWIGNRMTREANAGKPKGDGNPARCSMPPSRHPCGITGRIPSLVDGPERELTRVG